MEPVKKCIEEFMDQFVKERQLYEDHCQQAEKTVKELIKQKGIMGIVSSRVKAPDRLREKLIKRDREEKNYQTVDDIFRDIPDLIGLRVALYFPGDIKNIGELLKQEFVIRKSKEFPARVDNFDDCLAQGFTAYKRRRYPGYDERRFDGYCAAHHHICLPNPPGEILEFNPIMEIQVASLLMHAWSEVEHDLAYKNKKGEVSREEYEVLDEINGLVLAGEIALQRLDQLSRRRIESENAPITTPYALQSFLEKWQDDHGRSGRYLGNVEILFKLYSQKNMLTPAQVKAELAKLPSEGEASEQPLADQLIDLFDNKTMVKKAFAEALSRLNSLNPETTRQVQLGAFMTNWNKVERAVQQALRAKGHKAPNSVATWRLVIDENVLTKEIKDCYHDLRVERNKIVHGYAPSTAAAFESLNAEMDKLLEMLKEEYGV